MRKSIGLFCLVIAANLCVAEELPIHADSLKALLLLPQPDTARVDLLITLARAVQHSEPEEAIRYAEEALSLSQESRWPSRIARSYGTLGNIYHAIANYSAALDYYQRAIKVGALPDDRRFHATLLNNMGMIHAEMSNFTRAIDTYEEALSVFREMNVPRGEAVILMNMGVIAYRQHDHQRSIAFSEQSLKIAEDSGYAQVAAYALGTIGLSLVERGETRGNRQDCRNALASLKKSLEYAEKTGDTRVKAQALGGIGQAYVVLGELERAEGNLMQSLQIAQRIGSLQYQREAYEWLSKAFEKQKRYDRALETYKNYILLRDSILNDEKKQAMARMEMQFDFERREALLKTEHERREELAFEELKQKRFENTSILGGTAIVLLGGTLGFVMYRKKREAEFKVQVNDVEMKALRSQMNPHFIFNSLNSIGDYMRKHDLETADYYLSRFAKLMRMILENSEKQEIPLAEDLKALALYMDLESMRLARKFVYEVLVDDDIDKESTMVPPLLLQPFVENSIWHGLAPKPDGGRISIKIQKHGDMMHCLVEDNGVGRKKEQRESSDHSKQSFGLKLAKARLDILNQRKQAQAAVELTDIAEGTRVEVRLPLAVN
jgi:tetratricopeptide (TPR) repeat protein